MSEEHGLVRREEQDGSVTITIDRPPLNVLDIKTLKLLAEEIGSAEGARMLVLRAEGKVFSAGADVGEHLPERAAEMLASFHDVFRRLHRLRGLSVALVQGAALGGGCELAAFCDLVLASENASFGQPEVLVGVFPPVAALVWPRLVGLKKAVELMVSGDKVSAGEALRLGLVNKVFPAETFHEEAMKFLSPLRNRSLVVIEHVKKAARIGLGQDFPSTLDKLEALYLDSLMKYRDPVEGLRAFLEKRKPNWQDR